MTDGKTFREYIRQETAKLKAMTFHEKRLYIWEYYKLHVLGLVVGVFLLGSLLNTLVFNPPPQDYLYIAWLGPATPHVLLENIAEQLLPLVENPDRQTVTITSYAVSVDVIDVSAMQQRFAAMLHTASINIILTSEAGVGELVELQWIRPIYELPGNPFSVDLYGSPLLAAAGIDSYDLHLTLPVNSQHFYRVEQALEMLLDGVS